jgi:hydrogenase maturation protein HypF
LRQRKGREEKPLALLAPSIEAIREMCVVSEQEEALLQSPAAPIVLLEKRSPDTLSPWIAPVNPNLGVMLPYSPLHHVLLRLFGKPLVATSGNVSDEPICIDEQEGLGRLWGIADSFLVHNRPILRPVDDSVVRVMLDRSLMLRRARGYAPLPVFLDVEMPPILAVGPHLKNTSAVSKGTMVFLSQHIGDLETAEAYHAFTEISRSLPAMYDIQPEKVACDLHPDYSSTRYAQSLLVPVIPVQHHHAHIVSCMADNGLDEPVLGVAWDGTGYGTDGTVWGSEFLLATRGDFTRMAHLRAFPLPSGDKASREPRRAALGLLYAMGWGDRSAMASFLPGEAFSEKELTVLWQMLQKNLNTPLVCSAGRLFDAVASLLGVRHRSSFEGQAAIELEYRVDPAVRTSYPFLIHAPQTGDAPLIIDWEPIILSIVESLRKNTAIEVISTAFHNTLVEIIVGIAKRAQQQAVVLSGGCFQNRYLTEQTVSRLRASGFSVYWHKDIPPNDGGIALGQVVAASRME